jgi:hypothetical protein
MSTGKYQYSEVQGMSEKTTLWKHGYCEISNKFYKPKQFLVPAQQIILQA